MAAYQNLKAVNLVAGEDLRGAVYGALTLNGSGQVVQSTAATDVILGNLAEEPRTDEATTGLGVPVALVAGGGVGVFKAAGAVNAGDFIIPTTTAGAVGGSANPVANAIGRALESAVAGDEFRVLVQPTAA